MGRWQPDARARLQAAALTLYGERGYESTTVAEIAERAGLTKRTFFRYFSDKREVLFGGTQEFEDRWHDGMAAAPADAEPLEVIRAAFGPLDEMFADRHEFAQLRTRVISSNPEL